MPPRLVRMLLVLYGVPILLVFSRFREAMEAYRWVAAALMLVASLALIIMGWFLPDAARRPVALRIEQRGLVAGPGVVAVYGLLVVLAISLSAPVDDWPREGITPLLFGLAAYLVGSVVILLWPWPHLILTPEGVAVRRPLRPRRGGWDAVPWKWIEPERLEPRKDFVEFALRHYEANPVERAEIGSAAGLARLQEAFALAQRVDRGGRDLDGDGVVRVDAGEDGVARA